VQSIAINNLYSYFGNVSFNLSVTIGAATTFSDCFWEDRNQIPAGPHPSACQSPRTDGSKSLTCFWLVPHPKNVMSSWLPLTRRPRFG